MSVKLSPSFYLQSDVIKLSQELLGKVLCSYKDGEFTSGIICETEAYAGEIDKASHAYGGRRTKRTETMYQSGGISYVYLCYGIHHLFNVVSNRAGVPHACLIRGIYPLDGKEVIVKRRKQKKLNREIGIGPGKVTQALGINKTDDTTSLQSDSIWIEDRSIEIDKNQILVSKRIGIDYAEEDADLPYRFEYHSFILKD